MGQYLREQRARAVLRGAMLSCLLSFAPSASPANAADALPQTADAARRLVNAGVALVQKGDFAGAEPKMQLVLASPAFPELTLDDQYLTWAIIGAAELRAHKPREALETLRLACASPVGSPNACILKLYADKMLDDPDGVSTLLKIASQAPQSLSHVSSALVTWAVEKTVAISDGDTIALADALQAAHWNPDRYNPPETMWLPLARAYLRRGDIKDAAAAIDNVSNVVVLIAVRSEKTFDPIVSMNPDHFDIAKAVPAEIAKYTQWSREEPNRLEAVLRLADTLILANRPNEALTVIDAALARLRGGNGNTAPFKDAGKLDWLLDSRANALLAGGRVQEALDAMTAAAQEKESGGPNVSQAINLADMYNSASRPNDAVAALASVPRDRASNLGRMKATSAKLCAYAQLADSTKVQEQLDYIQAHVADDPEAMFRVRLCTNDMDGAASSAIALLRDPINRWGILIDLQEYEHSKNEPAVLTQRSQQIAALRVRPDVAAALAAVGRVTSYPILRPSH